MFATWAAVGYLLASVAFLVINPVFG